jgi:hypothetical protein
MTQEIANRRGVSGFDVFIALVNGTLAIAFSLFAFVHWQRGEIDDALRPIGMVLFFIMAPLLMLSCFRKYLIAKDIVCLFGICAAWFACYWHRQVTITFKFLLAILLLIVVWRVIFHLRNWRLNRQNTNTSSDIDANQGGRT